MKNLEKILIFLSIICLTSIGITLILIIIDRKWYELQGTLVWVFALYAIIIIGIIAVLTGFLSKKINLLILGVLLLGYAFVTFFTNGIKIRFGTNQLLSNWLHLITTSILIFILLKNVSNTKKLNGIER